MPKLKFMPWLDALPEVGDPICSTRDELAAMLEQANELESRAMALRATVEAGRKALLVRVLQRWTLRDLESAGFAVVPLQERKEQQGGHNEH